jgi:hypothetical protein
VKVRVVITLDIDPEAYSTEYGVAGAAEIRRDVRQLADTMVYEHLNGLGLLRHEGAE